MAPKRGHFRRFLSITSQCTSNTLASWSFSQRQSLIEQPAASPTAAAGVAASVAFVGAVATAAVAVIAAFAATFAAAVSAESIDYAKKSSIAAAIALVSGAVAQQRPP